MVLVRLLVAKFWGSQKLCAGFLTVTRQAPLTSTLFKVQIYIACVGSCVHQNSRKWSPGSVRVAGSLYVEVSSLYSVVGLFSMASILPYSELFLAFAFYFKVSEENSLKGEPSRPSRPCVIRPLLGPYFHLHQCSPCSLHSGHSGFLCFP